jgi:membrane protease YdiL (CAAX protease family)
MSQEPETPRGRPAPWLYLFGVIAWTWTLHGIVALIGQPMFEFPAVILALLGALGPSIVAGFLVAMGRWDPSLDRNVFHFFRRAFDPRVLPWRWYLWILGLAIALAVLPVLLDPAALREHGLIERGPGLFLLVGLIIGGLEEPGWRGYAQEGLQRRMPVVLASLVVGIFWAAWHLPLFFITGTYQAGLGVGTPAFWAFNLGAVVGCPVYAWLYNAAGRVTLAAVLYHGLSNLVRELVPDVSNATEVGVEAALALIVTLVAWERTRHPRLD